MIVKPDVGQLVVDSGGESLSCTDNKVDGSQPSEGYKIDSPCMWNCNNHGLK